MQSPLPWPGGKKLLIKQLLEAVPKHEFYVEVFSGSATLLFAKERSKGEIINDIDGELTNFFQCVRDNWRELVEAFHWLLHSKKWFNDLLKTSPQDLSKVERACRFFYLRKSSFSGLGRSFARSKRCDDGDWLRKIRVTIEAAHKRLLGVIIDELDFQKCIETYDTPTTFFYCDPPYRLMSNGMYIQLMTDSDFLRLVKALNNCEGQWLVSHSDDLLIREIFKEHSIEEVKTKYSLSGGKNEEAMAAERKELLISNYRIKDVGQVKLF